MLFMNQIAPEIKHFYHRAGFGIGLPELQERLKSGTYSDLVDEAVSGAIDSIELEGSGRGSPMRNGPLFADIMEPRMQPVETVSTQLDQLRASWVKKMIESPSFLAEKMTLFWHTHFACQCTTEYTALQYLNVLRKHALGNFKTLLHAVARTPAMIIFLNNLQNRKDHPNENFARELMELFTMGRGNYSEQDVKESARAFTGWSADRQGNFLFKEANHDFGEKQFLKMKGNFDGSDIIDIILQQSATPLFLADKLYRFFVREKSDPTAVRKLAEVIRANDYQMSEVMRFLFSSDFFQKPENRGNRIKPPLELLVQVARIFKINYLNPTQLSFLQKALGQLLFEPPDVAGWHGGRHWINNSTLMLRLNLVRYLLNQERFDHSVSTPLEAMAAGESIQIVEIKHDHSALLERLSGTRYEVMEEVIKNILLASNHTTKSISRPKDFRDSDHAFQLILKVVSLPEFQMS